MTYATSLQLTATTAWSTWYAYSDRACHDTAKVYRWYVGTFFSDAANARYEWAGRQLWLASAFAFGLGVVARRVVQHWVDAQVAAATSAAEVDPFDPSVNPLPEVEHAFIAGSPVVAMAAMIAPPVATLTVPAEAKPPTTAELRKRCQDYNNTLPQGDPRRIKRAGHLTKQQALEALAKV